MHEKELHIKFSIPDELIALVDGEKMARVFNNVIKNAIMYSYPQTAIDICMTSSDDNITVMIANHGNTIPNDKLEHIFDKFYRADENYQTRENGTGLGLAIAKEIVRMHNGLITATSIDEITTFTITLPIAKE